MDIFQDSINDGFISMMYKNYQASSTNVDKSWQDYFASRAQKSQEKTPTMLDNSGYTDQMREQYQADPNSVSEEWRKFFVHEGEVAAAQVPALPAPAHSQAPEPAADKIAAAPESRYPKDMQLQGPPKVLAKYMTQSLQMPTATSGREMNVEKLWNQRKMINAAISPQKISFTHIIAWALVCAVKDFPNLNSTYAEDDNKAYHLKNTDLNFGLAVDVQRPDGTRGLIVPVIHKANEMSVSEFVQKYDELVARSRDNKLKLTDLQGATITLTNPGGIGTTFSVPRLLVGQAAIVALGAIHLPAGVPKDMGAEHIMMMTNTYDHRVIQGAESGAYLKKVEEILSSDAFYQQIADELAQVDGASEPAQGPPAKEIALPAETADATTSARPATELVPQIVQSQQARLYIHDESELEDTKTYEEVQAGQITADAAQLSSISKAMSLVKAHRTHGHLAAKLDPLGSEPSGDPALTIEHVGLNEQIMQSIPSSVLRVGVQGDNFLEAYHNLQAKYCSTIAYEFEHIADHEQRVWMRSMIESGRHFRAQRPEEQKELLERLTRVEVFEKYIKRAYLGSKQFSVEGVDMLIPMLDRAMSHAAARGGREVVLGMAHRGRLNVLAHIIGRSYEDLMVEFEAEKRMVRSAVLPKGGTGDVKYHQGAEGVYQTNDGEIKVSLSYNPSHLEYVTPVVVGRARAAQTSTLAGDLQHDPHLVLPVIIHGDAAFPGQGVVGETLNMQALDGYSIGGTLHIIANNQIGFTTDPSEGRSTRYASDPAKGYDVPIIHVNADDPEACMAAMRLALSYRDKFAEDVIIDLVGYRRWGHNEGDEPSYTQPLMARKIKDHPRVRELFVSSLVEKEMITEAEAQEIEDQITAQLKATHEKVQARETVEDLGMRLDFVLDEDLKTTPDTTISGDLLSQINQDIHRLPDTFTAHPKLLDQLKKREAGFENAKINWAHAEALALASLICEGSGVRLTGQDVERGTFSHRHMVLHDVNTNEKYSPIQNMMAAKNYLQVYNSPLSEAAAIGFEYGYSTRNLDQLTIWEAQFGDFINSAQVYIDQFIAAGVAKWGQTTRLTLLLPHGYEGNGPEHSSGRLERFLQLAAEGNMRIVNPTTPAQYFHLLRRQAKINLARPLIVMSPKAILRLPLAVSSKEELSTGEFKRCLVDPQRVGTANKVKRLVLCSGKIYYEMIKDKAYQDNHEVAIGRLEMIAPFPKDQIKKLLATYPNAKEIVWAQEEPQNMGAWHFVERHMRDIVGDMQYAGRPERASVSEGYYAAHLVEQARIIREALGG